MKVLGTRTKSENGLAVRFCFESPPSPNRSVFQEFARACEHAVTQNPLEVPHLPFAQASKVGSGVLDPHGMFPAGAEPTSRSESRRLRSIEFEGRPLLEHTYDSEGRLARTSYFDGETVVYRWDEATRQLH